MQPPSRLKNIEAEIKDLKRKTALGMIGIGDKLIEAKALVPHGEWEQWLADNIEMSSRTARNYMQLAKTFTGEKRQAIAEIEVTKLYYLAELSEQEREKLLTTSDIKTISTRELKGIIRQEEQRQTMLTPIFDDEHRRMHKRVMESNDIRIVTEWAAYLRYLGQAMGEIILDLETMIGNYERQGHYELCRIPENG